MKIFFSLLSFVLFSAFSTHAADHAAVLLYHHVSSETPASTSITPQLFRQHLQYLDTEGFRVLPLSHVLKILTEGGELPERTVCITFDDGYRSILDEAVPLLRERDWPFTVFVSTDAVDRASRNYLDWDDLRLLVTAGAEIGNHSRSHAHLVRRLKGETGDQWRTRVTNDIRSAGERIKSQMGSDIPLFAYPYGEHTPELREIVASLGYFGISQQSGAVGPGFAKLAVPRFPMATHYDDMSRFILSANARPLPVKDVDAGPTVQIAGTDSRHVFAFTLVPGAFRLTSLACYSSSGEKLVLEKRKQDEGTRITIRLPAWGAGRRKVNCTAPSTEMEGIYYWYSQLWLVRESDGSWYRE